MHMYVYVYCTCIHHHCHNRFMALFPGPPGWVGARRKLFLDFMVLGRITRCRHTNNPRGATPCGPISNPPPSIPCIFTLDAFLLQPSQFTLAWDRHRSTLDCIPRWLDCTVRVSLLLTGLPAGHPMVFKLLRGQIVGLSPCRESVVAPIELEFGTDTTIGWLLPVMFYLISEEAWIREHHKIKIWSILWSLVPQMIYQSMWNFARKSRLVFDFATINVSLICAAVSIWDSKSANFTHFWNIVIS